jgi:2-methylaconitate cis-trans-isomerase PrpF
MLKLSAAAVLILSAVVATGAVAADGLTREQVRAEVRVARAAGTLDITETNYPREFQATKSTLTRAEVKAEVIRARAAGELDVTESTHPFPTSLKKSRATRAEVLAEAIRAPSRG